MWQLTFIGHGEGGKGKLHSVTTPSGPAALALYWAMRDAGWAIRLWTPEKELAL